jgi:hypothetical protein
MNIISIFNSVRDIPYRISVVWGEENLSCIGKCDRLYNQLKAKGYQLRYRICTFKWSSINLPDEIKNIPHEDECNHTYLEIHIDGGWKILDATWDSRLKNIFHINEWDGKSNTRIGVKPMKIFSPDESEVIVRSRDKEGFIKNRKANGRFFQAINKWLEQNRI